MSADYCKGGTSTSYLQVLDMQIMPQEECKSFEGDFEHYNDTLNRCVTQSYSLRGEDQIIAHVLCAKNPTKGRSTCIGDSGGPLTVKQDGQHYLVGVTSGGYGCGLVSFVILKIWSTFSQKKLINVHKFQNLLAKVDRTNQFGAT